jgi:hypothetical protein
MKRLAVFMMIMLAGTAHAQKVSPFERGTQAFRAVLNRCGFQPLDIIQEAIADPNPSLIVLFGTTDVYDEHFASGHLLEFIRHGGAVLIASDQPSRGEMWGQLEIAINGGIVIAPPGDADAIYRGEYVECPLLQQPRRQRTRSKLDLLGTLRVATNRPSYFNRLPMPGEQLFGQGPEPSLNQARVIAELPTGCFVPNARQPFQAPERRFLFAIADVLGRGRYAVLADHSLFLNMMMLQNDNDNIAFAMNLTRWLSEDGKRNRVLLVDDGQVRTDFSLNIDYVDPPLPHPDVLGPMVDQLMASLERDNFFNEGIQKLMPPYRILRSTLLLLTVLAAVFFLGRMVSRRYRMDRAVAKLPDRVSDLATPMAAEMALTPGAIGAAARQLSRGTLEQLLGGPLDVKHPPIATSSRAWEARIRTIWETASGASRRIGRPSDLERLAQDLVDLQKAVERGDVRLATGADA